MNLPFHPMIVHFPIALTFILPALIFVFAYMTKTGKMNHQAWLIIIGLQLVTTITGYISLETGEDEEHQVEKVIDKRIIHEHEEAAEVFVGSTVLALVVSVAAFFLRKEIQFFAHMFVCLVSLVACYLAYSAGELGGKLVYHQGAANAYIPFQDHSNSGLLPTPGMNTSESTVPTEENESLKSDDTDYGSNEEDAIQEDGDDLKQEDD